MSRRLIYDAIRSDKQIRDYGIRPEMIFVNWSQDKSPTREHMFIIIRFGPDQEPRYRKASKTIDFTVWVHMPKNVGVDFDMIQKVLDRVRDLLLPIEHGRGDDGWEVTAVHGQGGSGDQQDLGFDTSTRNAAFNMLTHRIVAR